MVLLVIDRSLSMSVKSLSSVRKACRILSALVYPAVVRLTDIARVTGLDMTTCSRILSDLQKEGLVEREPQNKHYSLGNQAYLMHQAAFSRFCPAVFFKIVVTIFASSSLFCLGLFFRVQCDWANRLAVSNRT